MIGGEAAVAALVLCAAVMHAAWNAVVKADADRTVTLAFVLFVGCVIGVGIAAVRPLPDEAAWPWLAASAATHAVYYWCLLRAYREGDLGRVYPIARGTAPVLVVVGAAVIAAEVPGWLEIVGVVLVSAGILSLAWGGRGDGKSRAAVLWAGATGVTIAVYTVLDGTGARASGDAFGYVGWSFVLQIPGIAMLAVVAGRARVRAYLAAGAWRRGLAGGVVALLAWGIAIWAMTVVPIAHVAALRETSVIFAAAIGARMLGEPFGARRIAAAAVVAAGIALMHLA